MEIDEDEVLQPFVRKHDDADAATPSSSAGVAELPLARVRTIMQKGGDDFPISQEGLFAMAKAAEMFIAELTRNLYEATGSSNIIEYSHLADYVQDNDELDFLHDMIPRMIPFSEVLRLAKSANESADAD